MGTIAHAFIDGDMFVYRAGYASERNLHRVRVVGHEDEGVVFESEKRGEATEYVASHPSREYVIETETLIEPIGHALHNIRLLIEKIMDRTKAKDYTVVLSGSGNFREEIATTLPYKGNRWSYDRRQAERAAGRWIEWLDATESSYQYQDRPYHFDKIREYLADVHDAVFTSGEEADDMLGILQTAGFRRKKPLERNATTVIASLDKDMRMIPGYHFEWVKEELVYVSEFDAEYNFYRQLLTGDKTDNIRGLPNVSEATREKYALRKTKGVGPATAEGILVGATTPAEMEERVAQAYVEYFIEAGIGESEAHAYLTEQGRLLWIRRKNDEMWSLGRHG